MAINLSYSFFSYLSAYLFLNVITNAYITPRKKLIYVNMKQVIILNQPNSPLLKYTPNGGATKVIIYLITLKLTIYPNFSALGIIPPYAR